MRVRKCTSCGKDLCDLCRENIDPQVQYEANQEATLALADEWYEERKSDLVEYYMHKQVENYLSRPGDRERLAEILSW